MLYRAYWLNSVPINIRSCATQPCNSTQINIAIIPEDIPTTFDWATINVSNFLENVLNSNEFIKVLQSFKLAPINGCIAIFVIKPLPTRLHCPPWASINTFIIPCPCISPPFLQHQPQSFHNTPHASDLTFRMPSSYRCLPFHNALLVHRPSLSVTSFRINSPFKNCLLNQTTEDF